MTKPEQKMTPEELFAAATEGQNLSAAELRLLNAGLAALRDYRNRAVNTRETKALMSLVAYVADTQNASDHTVREILSSQFSVPRVEALPARSYQDAIAFLLDLNINDMVS